MSDFLNLINGAIDLVNGSPLKLGTVSFAGYEIPERMPFGGTQRLAVKHLIGGRKVIESVGYEPVNPTWSGRFQGPQAMSRAKQVDAMCAAGLPVQLSYAGMLFIVVIKSFSPSYERYYQIPYTIVCEVSTNVDAESDSILDNTLDDLVGADVLDSLGVGDIIGDVKLSDALTTAQAGLSAIGTLTGNPNIAKIGGYIGVAGNIADGIGKAANGNLAGAVFGAASSLGSVGINASRLVGAVSAANTLANSNAVTNLLSRAQRNLGG